jgi:hypothetical protein
MLGTSAGEARGASLIDLLHPQAIALAGNDHMMAAGAIGTVGL